MSLSLKISKRFLMATALAMATASSSFYAAANDTEPLPDVPKVTAKAKQDAAKPKRALYPIDYAAIYKTKEFKEVEAFLLEQSVVSGLTSEKLRAAARKGIEQYVTEEMPAKQKKATDRQLVVAALKGMASSLTPHDGFMDAEESKEFRQQMDGSFIGIGVELDTRDESKIKVRRPIPGGPSEKAGIKADDIILEVDGKSLKGLSVEDSIKKMRGEPDSRVNIKVQRGDQTLSFDLIRKPIRQENVSYNMLEGGVAHFHIRSFTGGAHFDLKHKLAAAKAEAMTNPAVVASGGLKGIILDFRYNPGGRIDDSNNIVDDYLDKEGLVVEQQGRNEDNSERHTSNIVDISRGLPMVVLVNEGSASASEIVAGALQDHKRAVIMGHDTFGKGTVQVVRPMAGGTIKTTIAIFRRPSGNSNQWVGVKPDIAVDTLDAKYEKYVHEKAITERKLPNSLPNTRGAEAQKNVTKQVCSPIRAEMKLTEGETDKSLFNSKGNIDPFLACARDQVLKMVNPSYQPRLTKTVPVPRPNS